MLLKYLELKILFWWIWIFWWSWWFFRIIILLIFSEYDPVCNENKVFAVVNWTSQILISLVGRYCFQFNAVNIAAGTEKFFQQVLKGFFLHIFQLLNGAKEWPFLTMSKKLHLQNFFFLSTTAKMIWGIFFFSLMQFGKWIRFFRPSYRTVTIKNSPLFKKEDHVYYYLGNSHLEKH